MEHFYQRFEADPRYGIVVPTSITLHRFERAHQDPSKPRIIVRECDDDGFTLGFTVNRIYKNTLGKKIDALIKNLNARARQRISTVLRWLEDPDTRKRIEAMAFADRCEETLYALLKEVTPGKAQHVDELSPLLVRDYDKRGIPIAYGLNPRITTIHQADDGALDLEVRGFPISGEELKRTNLDELLQKLTSPSEHE